MTEKEYIEREALIKICEEIIQIRWNETTAPVSWSHAYADFIEDIENQPSADVAPVRHAKWVLIDECVNEGVYCSNCHKKVYRVEYANQKVKSNYCPNCGAKMGGNKVE